MAVFVPDAGDLVWLTFDPQAGHEQAGRRPALVLSPRSYNQKSGLALVCPVTNQVKGYPFEVPLPPGCGASGAILADHLKSLDWRGPAGGENRPYFANYAGRGSRKARAAIGVCG